jgi:hypothetical protein
MSRCKTTALWARLTWAPTSFCHKLTLANRLDVCAVCACCRRLTLCATHVLCLQRALAALPAIRDLNPLVTVCTVDGSISTMSDDSLATYSVVCLASGTADELAAVDARCRRLSVPFIGSCTAGLFACAFFDFGSHTFSRFAPRLDCLCAMLAGM